MIVTNDPLALRTRVWSGRAAGPPCRLCRVNVSEGHRYYPEEGDVVIHYCCRAREEAAVPSSEPEAAPEPQAELCPRCEGSGSIHYKDGGTHAGPGEDGGLPCPACREADYDAWRVSFMDSLGL